MKTLAFLILIVPTVVFGQKKSDYVNAMSRFQKFYNAGQGDSINLMFRHDFDEEKKKLASPLWPMWTNKWAIEAVNKYGTLKSFNFIGIDKSDPNKVHVFETVFSKAGVKTTSMTLYPDNTLGTFRFLTESPEITKLQKRKKSTEIREKLMVAQQAQLKSIKKK